MTDRRFDVRVPCETPISLRWTDPAGEALEGTAILADISQSGASVRSQHPVKVGTVLFFAHQDQELAGKVTHCVSGPSGYVLGIEFEPGYRWSPRRAVKLA